MWKNLTIFFGGRISWPFLSKFLPKLLWISFALPVCSNFVVSFVFRPPIKWIYCLLRYDVQRLCFQFRTGPRRDHDITRGASHTSGWTDPHDAAVGGRRSRGDQPEDPNGTAADARRTVPGVRLHRTQLLPRPRPDRSPALDVLRQVQDGAPQQPGNVALATFQQISYQVQLPKPVAPTGFEARN